MRKILLAMSFIVVVGCGSAPPTIQQGPNAEVSYDGLHAIDNSRFKLAWADPDIDFSRYTKIMPGGAFLEFRAVKKMSQSESMSSSSDFYIDDKNKERLREETTTIFREEMAKSTRFSMVEAPGPDVLIISGGLHDIVSNVPPEPMGRSDIYLTSVGEMSLILEAADSRSNEVIFRAVERRAADSQSGKIGRANKITNWADINRLLRHWAVQLREGLDSIPEA